MGKLSCPAFASFKYAYTAFKVYIQQFVYYTVYDVFVCNDFNGCRFCSVKNKNEDKRHTDNGRSNGAVIQCLYAPEFRSFTGSDRVIVR